MSVVGFKASKAWGSLDLCVDRGATDKRRDAFPHLEVCA